MPRSTLPLVLAAATVAAPCALGQPASTNQPPVKEATEMAGHPYIGMWVTGDGHSRQALLPNRRYDEARGTRTSAYQGRYEIRGTKIDYRDDTGFTADGEFVDGVLHHAGMLFYREGQVK